MPWPLNAPSPCSSTAAVCERSASSSKNCFARALPSTSVLTACVVAGTRASGRRGVGRGWAGRGGPDDASCRQRCERHEEKAGRGTRAARRARPAAHLQVAGVCHEAEVHHLAVDGGPVVAGAQVVLDVTAASVLACVHCMPSMRAMHTQISALPSCLAARRLRSCPCPCCQPLCHSVSACWPLTVRPLELLAAELTEDLRHRLAHHIGQHVQPACTRGRAERALKRVLACVFACAWNAAGVRARTRIDAPSAR